MVNEGPGREGPCPRTPPGPGTVTLLSTDSQASALCLAQGLPARRAGFLWELQRERSFTWKGKAGQDIPSGSVGPAISGVLCVRQEGEVSEKGRLRKPESFHQPRSHMSKFGIVRKTRGGLEKGRGRKEAKAGFSSQRTPPLPSQGLQG